MKKIVVLALWMLSIVTLLWCNKNVEEVIVEQPAIENETTQEIVVEIEEQETVGVCDPVKMTIDAYKWKIDMWKYLDTDLEKYSYVNITAKMSQDFVDRYRYEDSEQFFFAMKVFVGNHTNNGGYYDVLRTRSLSVANRNYLTGAITAKQLSEWFTRTVPLNEYIYVANTWFVEWRQFLMINLSNYYNEWNTRIWAYVSSVKELAGRSIADIEIELCY